MNSKKLETLIDFPITNFDLTDVVLNPELPHECLDEEFNKTTIPAKGDSGERVIYDLYGVVNHSGSVGFGHYHAYVKNFRANKWYDYNDSSVHEISEDRLVSSQAYVLFYKRRNAPICHVYQKGVKMEVEKEQEDIIKEEEELVKDIAKPEEDEPEEELVKDITIPEEDEPEKELYNEKETEVEVEQKEDKSPI